MIWKDSNLINILQNGGVAVIPTDTIYGIVCRAEDSYAVERVYAARKRAPQKPCIILIGAIEEIEKFDIHLTEQEKNKLFDLWVNQNNAATYEPTSVVLDCPEERKLEYLHRGTYTLAFRMPRVTELQEMLLMTGPLIAPSANPEGFSPSENPIQAEKYFGKQADIYIDGGDIVGKPSKVIKMHTDGTATVLRE